MDHKRTVESLDVLASINGLSVWQARPKRKNNIFKKIILCT